MVQINAGKGEKMKKKHLICLVLIGVCLIIFYAYRGYESSIVDNKAPKISVSESISEISIKDPEEVLLTGVKATDNVDGDVSHSLIVEKVQFVGTKGKAKVTIAAFDKNGNVAKTEREVQYVDYDGLRFSLNSSLTFSQNSNFDIYGIVKVVDVFDGDISHRIRATTLEEVSITAVGLHNVEFKVTNSLGDTAEIVLPIEVYPQGTYEASLSLKNYLVYLPKDANFNRNDYLKSFTLNGETTDLSGYLPSGFYLRTNGEVDTSTPGIYSVSYYVTQQVGSDNYGIGQAYQGYAKLIVVVEE